MFAARMQLLYDHVPVFLRDDARAATLLISQPRVKAFLRMISVHPFCAKSLCHAPARSVSLFWFSFILVRMVLYTKDMNVRVAGGPFGIAPAEQDEVVLAQKERMIRRGDWKKFSIDEKVGVCACALLSPRAIPSRFLPL